MTPMRWMLLLVATACASSALAEDHFSAPAFERLRAGASSRGPLSLPSEERTLRKPDLLVRPTTFQSVSNAKPLLSDDDLVGDRDENTLRPFPAEGAAALSLTPTPTSVTIKPIDAAESAEDAIVADSPQEPKRSGRRLGAPTKASTTPVSYGKNPLSKALEWRPAADTLTTIGSGLAVVLGLLFISVWALKKSLPKSARVLPGEVAEVLGRVPLGRKQTAQLIKIGRKLVLVSSTPDGLTETITEINSEEEVQHLLRLCEESGGRGSSVEFEKVFRQMSGEPAPSGFLGAEAPEFDPQRLAAAYANTPGGQGRG